MLDGLTDGEVRSEPDKKGFFINVTTVLSASARVGHPAETFGSAGNLSAPKGPKTLKMARPPYIPDNFIRGGLTGTDRISKGGADAKEHIHIYYNCTDRGRTADSRGVRKPG